MKKENMIIINGTYISGIIRASKQADPISFKTIKPPIFISENMDRLPEFIHRHNGAFVSGYEYDEEFDTLVLRDGKIFDLEEIEKLILELNEVKDQLVAFHIADELSK